MYCGKNDWEAYILIVQNLKSSKVIKKFEFLGML